MPSKEVGLNAAAILSPAAPPAITPAAGYVASAQITANVASAKKETPSLTNIFLPKQGEVKPIIDIVAEQNIPLVQKSVSKAEIQAVILHFINNTKVNSPLKMILAKPFELVDETKIVIPISNSVEVSMMKNIETELLNQIRNKLGNSLISIEYNQEAASSDIRPYTNSDKFEALAKKNPHLYALKDLLGLDTDF